MRPDNPGNKIRGIVALPHGAVNTRPVQPGTQRVTVISLSPDKCWANSLPSTAGPSGSLSSSSIAQSLLTALYLLVQQVPFIASKDRHGTTRRRSWLILCPPRVHLEHPQFHSGEELQLLVRPGGRRVVPLAHPVSHRVAQGSSLRWGSVLHLDRGPSTLGFWSLAPTSRLSGVQPGSRKVVHWQLGWGGQVEHTARQHIANSDIGCHVPDTLNDVQQPLRKQSHQFKVNIKRIRML